MTPDQKNMILDYVELTGQALAKAAELSALQEKTASSLRSQAGPLAKALAELGFVDALDEKRACEMLSDATNCQLILGNVLKDLRKKQAETVKTAAASIGAAVPDPAQAGASRQGGSPIIGLQTSDSDKPYNRLWSQRLAAAN